MTSSRATHPAGPLVPHPNRRSSLNVAQSETKRASAICRLKVHRLRKRRNEIRLKELSKKWCPENIWTPSCYYGSYGHPSNPKLVVYRTEAKEYYRLKDEDLSTLPHVTMC
ncbi:hypothetical protein C8F04DRAFT_1229260 [Mycena alexandri]|uniref:Uncharacterized protein n=1 Tax=Mycena alexandri TaxID=1745969 RepID=A0AAD6TC67_9AGAR|nr:hypothetical protein C8F04DRAFT_1229260 [Mycena alexandri]